MSETVKSLIIDNPEQFKANCNGVGSPAGFWGFFWRFTPGFLLNFMFGLNIREVADLHDNEYTVPHEFKTLKEAEAHKKQADQFFEENLETKINQHHILYTVDFLRKAKATLYDFLLTSCGDAAFYKNKIILDEQPEKFE